MNSTPKLKNALTKSKMVLIWIKRFFIGFMVLWIIAGLIFEGVKTFRANAAETSLTVTRQAERIADPLSANRWLEVFNEGSTRNNGEIWMDLSHIPYDERFVKEPGLTEYLSNEKSSSGKVQSAVTQSSFGSSNRINWKTLTMDQAVEDFTIDFDDDFLSIFSVLGSTQRLIQSEPIDLVIILDVSKSMAEQEVVDGIAKSRIERSLTAVNEALNFLFNSENFGQVQNRAAVAVYGTRAEVLLPLDAYHSQSEDYLKLGYLSDLEFSIQTEQLIKPDGSVYFKEVNNSEQSGIGGATNLQAGLYSGLNLLARESDPSGRIPMSMILTDGGANALCEFQSGTGGSHASWISPDPGRAWFASDSPETHSNETGIAIILSSLLTAGYQRILIENNYNRDLETYSFGLDITTEVSGNSKDVYPWAPSRINAILNPSVYFNSQPQNVKKNIFSDPEIAPYAQQITDAYSLFEKYIEYSREPFLIPEDPDFNETEKSYVISFLSPISDTEQKPSELNLVLDIVLDHRLDDLLIDKYEGDYELLADALEQSVYFVPEGNFYNLDDTNVEDCFVNVLKEKSQSAYQPVNGANIFGQQDVITFSSPLEPQMEVKSVTALSLFGKNYSIEAVPVVLSGFDQSSQVVSQYQIRLPEEEKQSLNPAYGSTIPFSEIYIWVEEAESDSGKEQTLYFQIPTEALPVVSSSVQQSASDIVLTDNYGQAEALPLRLFYTCGVRDEYLNASRAIVDHASASQGWNLNKFSSLVREEKNYSEGTGYLPSQNGHGDAYASFSPSWQNGYYVSQQEMPVYQKAWFKASDGWKEAGEEEIKDKWLTLSVLDTYQSADELPEEADTGILALSNPVLSANDFLNNPGPFYLEEHYLENINGQAYQVKKIIEMDNNSFSSSYLRDETGYNDFLVYYDPVSQSVTQAFEIGSSEVSALANPGNHILAYKTGGFRDIRIHEKAVDKVQNPTQSASTVSASYMVDANPAGSSDPDSLHVLTFLGNNARITSVQEGFIIGKEMAGTQQSEEIFSFEMTVGELAGGNLQANRIYYQDGVWNDGSAQMVETYESMGKDLALNQKGNLLEIDPVLTELEIPEDSQDYNQNYLVAVLNPQITVSKEKGLVRADLIDSDGTVIISGMILPVFEIQQGEQKPVTYLNTSNEAQEFVWNENEVSSGLQLTFDGSGRTHFELAANEGLEFEQFPQGSPFTVSETDPADPIHPAAVQDREGNFLKYTPGNEETVISVQDAKSVYNQLIFKNGIFAKSLISEEISDNDTVAVDDLLEYAIDWFAPGSVKGSVTIKDDLDEHLIFQGAYLNYSDKLNGNGLLLKDLSEGNEISLVYNGQSASIKYEDYKVSDGLAYGGTVTWTLPAQALENGTVYLDALAAEVDEKTTVLNQAGMEGLMTNIVTNFIDPVLDPDNEVEEPDPENPKPDVSIEKTQLLKNSFQPASTDALQVVPQDEIVYFITVQNNSETDLENLIIWDLIPEGMLLQQNSVSDSFETGKEGNFDRIDWTIGLLKAGESKTVNFAVTVPSAQKTETWVNKAWCDLEEEDSDPMASNEVVARYTPENQENQGSSSDGDPTSPDVTSNPQRNVETTSPVYSTGSTTSNSINTGNYSFKVLWMTLALLSAVLLLGIGLLHRDQNRKQERKNT